MEKDYLISLVERGLSTRQIAELSNKGQTTIRHWLKKYNLKTDHKSFKNGYEGESTVLRIDGKPIQNCSCCGILLDEENAYWRKRANIWSSNCKKCHNKKVGEKWRSSKKKAVEYKGGKCERCGYNKCTDALEFHHLDPSKKDKNFGSMKLRKWEDQKKELDKCIMVCANCHREIHSELRMNKTQPSTNPLT